jgi:hypothetical protein
MQFQAEYRARQPAAAGGEEAAAGADLQHFVGRCQRQCLQHPAFDHRLEHDFAMADRDLQVGIRHRAVRVRDEGIARHRVQDLEYARVQHVPRAHLLLDHGFADFGVIGGGGDCHRNCLLLA